MLLICEQSRQSICEQFRVGNLWAVHGCPCPWAVCSSRWEFAGPAAWNSDGFGYGLAIFQSSSFNKYYQSENLGDLFRKISSYRLPNSPPGGKSTAATKQRKWNWWQEPFGKVTGRISNGCVVILIGFKSQQQLQEQQLLGNIPFSTVKEQIVAVGKYLIRNQE